MDQEWLLRQFESKPDKSKGDLAQFLGASASAVSKMLAGTRQIKAKEYMAMRKFFGQPVMPESKYVNIDPATLIKPALSDAGDQTNLSSGIYEVVDIADTAMMPMFMPGERVLVDTEAAYQNQAGIFALKAGAQIIIRIIEPKTQGYDISCLNKSYVQNLQHIKIMGRVVAKLHWL